MAEGAGGLPDVAGGHGLRQLAKGEVGAHAQMLDRAAVGAQRNTRILGVFGRLWLRDGKPGYLKWLPRVWGLVERDLAHPELAALRGWFDRHVPIKWRRIAPSTETFKLPEGAASQ